MLYSFQVEKFLYNELLLYVIQLSDRVYNVTFPAYDVYSFRQGI
jgi:hypothetical protein